MKKQPQLIGVDTDYGCDVGGVFQAHSTKRLYDSKEQQNESKSRRKMSSCQSHIPTIVVEKWMREGSTSSQANTVQQKLGLKRKPTCVPDYKRMSDGIHRPKKFSQKVGRRR